MANLTAEPVADLSKEVPFELLNSMTVSIRPGQEIFLAHERYRTT